MSQPGGRAPQRDQTPTSGLGQGQGCKNQEPCPYGCYRCHRRGGSPGVLPAHAAVAVQHKMSLLCYFCPSCSTPRRETRGLSRTNVRAGAGWLLGLAAMPAFRRGLAQPHRLLSLLVPAQDAVRVGACVCTAPVERGQGLHFITKLRMDNFRASSGSLTASGLLEPG